MRVFAAVLIGLGLSLILAGLAALVVVWLDARGVSVL